MSEYNGFIDSRTLSLFRRARNLIAPSVPSRGFELFKRIVDKYPDLANASGDDGITLFIFAGMYGNERAMKYLIEKFGIDIESVDASGKTALMYATLRGELRTMEFLLKKGADANRADKNGSSSLDRAKKGAPFVSGQMLLEMLNRYSINEKPISQAFPKRDERTNVRAINPSDKTKLPRKA